MNKVTNKLQPSAEYKSMGSFVTFIIHLLIQYWKRTVDAQWNIIWQQFWVSAHLHMEYLEDWSFHNGCEPSQWHDNDQRTHAHIHMVCAHELTNERACVCVCVKQTSCAQWGCNTQTTSLYLHVMAQLGHYQGVQDNTHGITKSCHI